MTEQETALAAASIEKQLPRLIGKPLSAYARRSTDPIYNHGFCFGAAVTLAMTFCALAYNDLISAWFIAPTLVLMAAMRKQKMKRDVIDLAADIAAEYDVRVTIHTTGYIEFDLKSKPTPLLPR